MGLPAPSSSQEPVVNSLLHTNGRVHLHIMFIYTRFYYQSFKFIHGSFSLWFILLLLLLFPQHRVNIPLPSLSNFRKPSAPLCFCFCVSEKLLPEEICAFFFFFLFLFPLIQPVNFRSFQFAYSREAASWLYDVVTMTSSEKSPCSVSPSLGSTLSLLFSPKLSHSLANSFVKRCKLLHLFDAFSSHYQYISVVFFIHRLD